MESHPAGHHGPMTTGEQDYTTYTPPVAVEAEPTPRETPAADPEPVAWLLWPARVVAFCVVLPVRAVWEVLRGAARALGAALERAFGALGRALLAVLRPVTTVLLAPLRWIGRALLLPLAAAVGAVLAWLVERLLRPVTRALAHALRLLGGGLGAAWRAVTGAVAAVVSAFGRGLRALGRGVGRILRALVVRPLEVVLGLLAAGTGLLARALAAPLQLIWRAVLKPVGTALVVAAVALVMGVGRFLLQPLLRAIGAVLRGAGDVIGWAWHAAGRVLALLGRALVWPFVWLYRHVLTPLGHAIRGLWRAVVVAPWRAVRRTTSAALAAMRASVRDARRQVADQVRRAIGRPPR